MTSSLFHRVLPPQNPNAALHPTVVYIHGRGADEEDLLGLSGSFDERFLSIAVRAPFRFDYGDGYTWYEILEMGKPEPKMFKSSYEKLLQFIEEALANYPIDPKRLFLFGFSMGTVMAYSLALTSPQLFAGIIANSGYLAEQTHLIHDWHSMKDKPLFISHGRTDPVIPVAAAQRARDFFVRAGANVEYKEYDAGHQLSEQCVGDISSWLTQHIDLKPQ